MKKALISPIEPRETGYRVAWVSDDPVEHAPPFFWVDCNDDIKPDLFWYDPVDKDFKVLILPTKEQNKLTAIDLLTQTDWVNEPDVTNTSMNPHLLNQNDFLVYRSFLRRIAINPVAGDYEWPERPTPVWSDS